MAILELPSFLYAKNCIQSQKQQIQHANIKQMSDINSIAKTRQQSNN